MEHLKITQAISPNGKKYLIFRYFDGNNHDCFEIYEPVNNIKAVARDFGISDEHPEGKSDINTRVMCEKMMEIIGRDNLYTNIKKTSTKNRKNNSEDEND